MFKENCRFSATVITMIKLVKNIYFDKKFYINVLSSASTDLPAQVFAVSINFS